MSFCGKFVLEKRENYDDFAAASGANADQIEKGRSVSVTMEVTNDGDNYTVKRIFPHQTTTNTFTLGVPTELTFAEGKKAKATVTMKNGKMVMEGDNFSQVSEFVGNQLKETLTFKGKTMTRLSKRV